ncbi:MAG: phosphatase PAP2 family protein [Chloroflexi bacterium]|nr:phosphatase PAP2 family protein [Chloroflexota bacterium]
MDFGAFTSLDLALRDALLPLVDLIPVQAWFVLSALGSTVVLAVLALTASASFRARRDRLSSDLIYVLLIGMYALTEGLKFLLGRPRPILDGAASTLNDPLRLVNWDPSSGSLPSGHALQSFAVYGYLLIVLRLGAPARVAAISLIGLIGLSRVAVGAHWPTDVLAGWFSGALFLAALLSLRALLRRIGV